MYLYHDDTDDVAVLTSVEQDPESLARTRCSWCGAVYCGVSRPE